MKSLILVVAILIAGVELRSEPNVKESEVPVFQKEPAKKTNIESSAPQKLMLSLLVVSAIGLCGVFVLRRWKLVAQVDQKKTQIKVLTQFHLGPRKSLAIVRVAGESILIGITDHNISMIKSLSLIDDEFSEEAVPPQFSKALENSAEVQEEEFQLGKIQDQVLNKIKNLRRLA